MKAAAFLLLLLSETAFAQGAITLHGQMQWAYFSACGFLVPGDGKIKGASRAAAPNIQGYWIKLDTIAAIVDWRYGEADKGKRCASIYVRGADHAVHVIGTTEEILNKLRN